MKQFCIFLLCITLGICKLQAQTDNLQIHEIFIENDSISNNTPSRLIAMDTSRIRLSFKQNGYNLSAQELSQAVSEIPEAQKYMRKAMYFHNIGTSLNYLSGAFMGLSLGFITSVADSDLEVDAEIGLTLTAASAGLGAGCALLSLPFHAGYTKQAKRAVSIYNDNPYPPVRDNLQMNASPSNNKK